MTPSEKTPESTAANIVRLKNLDVGANIPGAELPPNLDRTATIAEKWQHLRRLIIGVVGRRGGVCGVECIGQEPAITSLRKGVYGCSKLQDFVKKFPMNF